MIRQRKKEDFKLEKSSYVVAPGPSLMAHVGVGSPGMGTPRATVRFMKTSSIFLSAQFSSKGFVFADFVLIRFDF